MVKNVRYSFNHQPVLINLVDILHKAWYLSVMPNKLMETRGAFFTLMSLYL